MKYVKGMVYDTEEDRIRYEDAYRKAWIAQCKVDAAVNPRLMLKLPEDRDVEATRRTEETNPTRESSAQCIGAHG
jgi:hypothetical protein